MKNVTCRNCGEVRPAVADNSDKCICGSDEIVLSLRSVTELVNSRDTAKLLCGSCNHEVFNLDVDAYPHSSGWKVPGLDGKYWLFISCPVCEYQTSFDKFGINR